MRHYLAGLFILGCLSLLTACQTNSVNNSLFSPFPSANVSLAQSVQETLMQNDDPVITRVHVESNQNTVILSGYVKKIRQSDVAEQIARQVPGVQAVQNNLIVRQ